MVNIIIKTQAQMISEAIISRTYSKRTNNCEYREALEVITARTIEVLKIKNNKSAANKANDFDDMVSAVEFISKGKNKVIFDEVGLPSVMVPFSIKKNSELFKGGSSVTHPAFIISGEEKETVYVSKFQNTVVNTRPYSLPLSVPESSVSYEDAISLCRSKGRGWSLTPFSLRAALALWCRSNGTMPRGNNNFGKDYHFPNETGIVIPSDNDNECMVKTGSGPNTWSHDGTADGIYDLNGNLNERDAGLRLYNGEIQIIPDSNCILPECDMGSASSQWRAIMPDGSLVEPGTEGTLKYDYLNGKVVLSTTVKNNDEKSHDSDFSYIGVESGLAVPEIAKALMLYPDEPGEDYHEGWRWININGECLPLCGGGWAALDHAGIFFVGISYPRTHNYSLAGFRSVYVENI